MFKKIKKIVSAICWICITITGIESIFKFAINGNLSDGIWALLCLIVILNDNN